MQIRSSLTHPFGLFAPTPKSQLGLFVYEDVIPTPGVDEVKVSAVDFGSGDWVPRVSSAVAPKRVQYRDTHSSTKSRGCRTKTHDKSMFRV
ncbi:hypothetical protein M8J77_012463 [Diaphorina citri]|nr:hypothetical protein M8J77_012463 [Diaphorina citri]